MNVFSQNRYRFSETLEGCVAVVAAYDAMQQTADMEAEFVQEGSFWWLTGIEEPGWKVIIEPGPSGRTTLVRPRVSEVHMAFNGALANEDARDVAGVKHIINAEDFEPYLRTLAKKHSVVQTPYNTQDTYEFVMNPAPKVLHSLLTRVFSSTIDCSRQLFKLRAIKQQHEIAAIKKAVRLTVAAFEQSRINLEKYRNEYEIEADFTGTFRRAGAKHAYQPIVASGKNACTLHYNKNQSRLKKNELVLIDIGARVDGYAADITRTYALNPTKRQVAIHEAVESASKKIIKYIGPGVSFKDLAGFVDQTIYGALCDLKILKEGDPVDEIRKYMPHSIGHGLGVDVHDRLAYGELKSGMVLTVEPGIYLPDERIGVRIEDDILITDKGRVNLSASLSTKL